MGFYGRDFICTQDFSKKDLLKLLELAYEMKQVRFKNFSNKPLQGKTFLMFFNNPSIRTHLSFVTAITELGGHAEFWLIACRA